MLKLSILEKYPHVKVIYPSNIHMLKFFTRKGPTQWHPNAEVVYVNRNFLVNLSTKTVSSLVVNQNENCLRLKFSTS